eukprot:1161629-Pelagomonas_calceolata.AAC.6
MSSAFADSPPVRVQKRRHEIMGKSVRWPHMAPASTDLPPVGVCTRSARRAGHSTCHSAPFHKQECEVPPHGMCNR